MGVRFPHQMPEGEEALLATINTTPLVDVMLVLLIIFLITIPVVNSSIAVTLPQESTHRVHRHAVAPHEPVVAEHRRHRDREAERRHDERFTHRARDAIDRRLP